MTYPKLNPSPTNQYTDTELYQAFDEGIADAHTSAMSVSTISDLKSVSVSEMSTGELRYVLGYHAIGDGGAGTFRYNATSTATDDTGTVIAPTTGSGRWERQLDEHINIKWFARNPTSVAPSRNLLTYSEAISDVTWQKQDATVTANNAADPIGGTTADTINVTLAWGYAFQPITGPPWKIVAGKSYTISMWVRRNTGTGNPTIALGGATGVEIPITSTLTRVSATVVAGSGTNNLVIYFEFTGTYEVWGVQLQEGPLRAYVPTTAYQDTNEDYSFAAQKASDLAATLGGREVYWDEGDYLLLSNVVVPTGIRWHGEGWTPNRFSGSGFGNPRGATLLIRGAQLQMGRGASAEGLTIFYDRQRYALTADGAQPDGIQDYLTYAATFRLDGQQITLKRLTYIGGTHFAAQKPDPTVYADLLRVDEIYGCPLKVGIQLDYVTDIPRLSNIHWNLNSYYDIIPETTKVNMHTKVAKNATAFLGGRVDEWYMQNVFTYGFREFLYFKNQSAFNSNDVGTDFGATLINCGSDVVHTFIRVARSTSKWFGVKAQGCWATPLVKSPIINGAVSTESPTLVRFESGCADNVIELANSHAFSSGAVAPVAGSGQMTNAFAFNSGIGLNNRVIVANSYISASTAALVTGETATSTVEFSNTRANDALIGSPDKVGADRGNNSVTLTMADAPIQRFTTAVTGTKTCVMPTLNLFNGASYRIVRRDAGAGTLNVQHPSGTTLRALAAGQWCELHSDGTTWYLSAAGAL